MTTELSAGGVHQHIQMEKILNNTTQAPPQHRYSGAQILLQEFLQGQTFQSHLSLGVSELHCRVGLSTVQSDVQSAVKCAVDAHLQQSKLNW